MVHGICQMSRFIACFFLLPGAISLANAVHLDIATYQCLGAKPYTEVWLRVDRQSVHWEKGSSQSKAAVDILLTISKVGDGTIAAFDKFSLQAVASDSLTDFLAVRRFAISPGEYTLSVEATDALKLQSALTVTKRILVEKASASYQMSDVMLLASVAPDSMGLRQGKNGLAMEPLPFGFAGKHVQQIHVYTEIFQPQPNPASQLFLQYAIMEGFQQSLNSKVLLTQYKKCRSLPEEAVLFDLPVHTLRSGDYHLVVSLVDKNKQVLAMRTADFTRINPLADMAWLESYNQTATNSFANKIPAEKMDYILKAHLPITDQHQVSTLGELLASNRLLSQRQFIFQLWQAKAPGAAEEAYNKYMAVAEAVDKKFYTNVGFGFQSDRGHIFLKYGKPTNVISVDTEVDASPYEIWYYNSMPQTRQTNVRFLFYNPTLAHNNYQLLHSTCLGEKMNPAWEVELYKSVPQDRLGPTIDAIQVKEGTNRNARRFFNEY